MIDKNEITCRLQEWIDQMEGIPVMRQALHLMNELSEKELKLTMA